MVNKGGQKLELAGTVKQYQYFLLNVRTIIHFKILRKQRMREMSHLQLEKEFLIAELQVIDW